MGPRPILLPGNPGKAPRFDASTVLNVDPAKDPVIILLYSPYAPIPKATAGQSRLILRLRDKACSEDVVPCVFPAKAGIQKVCFLCGVGAFEERVNERRDWFPACAGMTRVRKRAVTLTILGSLGKNRNGRLHLRRDCPGLPRHKEGFELTY